MGATHGNMGKPARQRSLGSQAARPIHQASRRCNNGVSITLCKLIAKLTIFSQRDKFIRKKYDEAAWKGQPSADALAAIAAANAPAAPKEKRLNPAVLRRLQKVRIVRNISFCPSISCSKTAAQISPSDPELPILWLPHPLDLLHTATLHHHHLASAS